MVSRQLVIGFAVSLTTVAIVTILVFTLLVHYNRKKRSISSRGTSSVGERYRPDGMSHSSPFRSEFGRDPGAFEHFDRPLQHRDPTPFSSLTSGHVTMDQSSLTGTTSHVNSLGRPTLAFGAPTRLQHTRPVNYSNGRVENGYLGDWEHNRPRTDRGDRVVTPRYHHRGMRTNNIPRSNYINSRSHSNDSRSVEGYLNNNIYGISPSYNDSGFSEAVIPRPQPLGGDSSLEETERSSSHSGSYIPAFMNNNHHEYPIRLHRHELRAYDEQPEDSYF